jgi:hypothetical protein
VIKCNAVYMRGTAQYHVMNGSCFSRVAPMALSMHAYYCRVAASEVALHRFLHSKCCRELIIFCMVRRWRGR